MKTQVIRPAAAKDIAAAYAWYEKERGGLGEEFLAEVHASIEAVVSNPLAYPVIYRQTRRVLIRRFPYGVFYRVKDDIIVVVACFHTSRNPKLIESRR